jgi:ubiquitin-protein ligase
MSNTCLKRLKKEIIMLEKNPDEFITLYPDSENIRDWQAVIRAPPDSAYEGFIFDIAVEVGSDYPLTPPKMKFLTKIFHPNVHCEVKRWFHLSIQIKKYFFHLQRVVSYVLISVLALFPF